MGHGTRRTMLALRILRAVRGNGHLLILSILFGLVFSAVGLVPPLLVRQAIRWVQDPTMASSFVALGGILLGVFLLRGVCRYFYGVCSHVAAYRTQDRLITRVYEHLQKLSPEFYSRERSGHLVSRAVGDIEAVEDFVAHGVPETLLALVIPAAMLSVLVSINWPLTLVCGLPVVVVAVAVYVLKRRTREHWRAVRSRIADLVAHVQDYVSGMMVIQAFGREKEAAAEIAHRSRQYRQSIVSANRWSLLPPGAVELASGVGIILVVAYGGSLSRQGTLPVADLVVFLMYVGQMMMPLSRLANLNENLQKAAASAERVFQLLDVRPGIVERPGAVVPVPTVVGNPRRNFAARVEFDGVHFAYEPHQPPVLKDVSFIVEPGDVVALVGPTGAGKTTAAKLVPRFYDVSAGAVRVAGYDVRDLSLSWLRRQVAMVLQDVYLFHGTVRENVRFGRPDATDAEIREAARAANAEEFILALPEGYDTLVGERAVRLSGGEKQRLSIARALLKDAPILILDEATSSIDVETEIPIQQAIARLTAGRTVLVIAHRLSTIQNAHRIVVIEDGRASQIGAHDELMATDGYYARMFRLQEQASRWQVVASGHERPSSANSSAVDVPWSTRVLS